MTPCPTCGATREALEKLLDVCDAVERWRGDPAALVVLKSTAAAVRATLAGAPEYPAAGRPASGEKSAVRRSVACTCAHDCDCPVCQHAPDCALAGVPAGAARAEGERT